MVSASRNDPAVDDHHDWVADYAALSAQDRRSGLSPEDVERMAVAAFLLGHDEEMIGLRERAYNDYLSRDQRSQAVRCAFWLGFHLQNRGDLARSAGWLAMQQRLASAGDDPDGPLTGLMVLAQAATLMVQQDPASALPLFDRAAQIAESAGDLDAFVLAGLGKGRCLEMMGRPTEAVVLMDEVMVHVLGGAVAPQVVGFAYCAMIVLCLRYFDVRRAQEWTQALTGWCDRQSGLVPYRGACMVHRAELLQLRGAWSEAVAAAQDACLRLPESTAVGSAHYRVAEIMRMQGRFADAQLEYARAARYGAEVQPGLAKLRAVQGNTVAAMAGLDRALGEDPQAPLRPAIQATRVDIALAIGDLDSARAAADDLLGLAADPAAPYLKALAAYGDGAVRLAEGDPRGAIPRLRRAWTLWQQVQAPYEAARTRVLVGTACRALGDEDAARMEADAARAVFEQLGAVIDLMSTDPADSPPSDQDRLTARECEVLRLVATGATNKVIAERLILSEKTVARHISNIFGKLGVSSRAAATAYAYEHHLA